MSISTRMIWAVAYFVIIKYSVFLAREPPIALHYPDCLVYLKSTRYYCCGDGVAGKSSMQSCFVYRISSRAETLRQLSADIERLKCNNGDNH